MSNILNLDSTRFVSYDSAYTTKSLDDLYSAWLADFQGATTAYATLSADDGASLLQAPVLWKNGPDKITLSYECGVEISTTLFSGNPASYQATIAGVSRYYSMNTGLRLAIIYHPPNVDSGITSIAGSYNPKLSVLRGSHNRGSENVQFVLRVIAGRQIDIAVKNTAQAAGLPVKLVVFDGTTVKSNLDLVTIAQGATLLVTCSLYGGTVSGSVVDQAGLPASRAVRIHNRDNGEVIGEGMSDNSGRYSIPVVAFAGTVMYVVALDDDTPPVTNAVIADRIVLE